MEKTSEEYRAEFLRIFEKYVHRKGTEEMLAWLDTTDFFTCPASTKFHGACKSGLVMHSLNVYHCLKKLNEDREFTPEPYSEETIAIVSLCHDFCKIGYYKESTRNVKNEVTGQWEKVPYFTTEDTLPYGHGEKSVYMLSGFYYGEGRLTREEAMAIRWHMGGFDDSVKGGAYYLSNAFDKYPLAVMTHLADLQATYLMEKGTSQVNNR